MQFAQMAMNNYLLDHAYDEMFRAPGEIHSHYEPLLAHFASLPADELQRRKQAADLSFLNQGITFTVYGRDEGTEKIFPYDLLPRIITAAEWAKVEHGLMQRITALNLFLRDIYNEGRILTDGIVRARSFSAASSTAATWWACRCRATSTSPSAAPTSSASKTASSSCWKTICAFPPASATCSPTGA